MYDLLIIGGGPAGLTAAIYAARGGLTVAVIEGGTIGGQASQTHAIENYPAFESIAGFELADKMRAQAEKCGAEIIYDNAVAISVEGDIKTVGTEYSGDLQARALLLCMGAKPKKLGVAGEDALIGRGVSYCATCDGAFYRAKSVAVVGGGNTAVTDALYLSKFAREVFLIHRRYTFRASNVLVDRLAEVGIKTLTDCVVTSLVGAPLQKIVVKNLKTAEEFDIAADGIFVAVGTEPASALAAGIVDCQDGYIKTDAHMRTSAEGIYAAGDITTKHLRQVITACADGAIAAETAINDMSARSAR